MRQYLLITGSAFHLTDARIKIFSLCIVLLLSVSAVLAQEESDTISQEESERIAREEYEQKIVDNSFTFFCDRIIDNDEFLSEVTIIFGGKTATAYSRVVHVANCAGDIDLILNEIPNREYINRLQEHYDRLPPAYKKVSVKNKRTKKFVLLKKNRILVDLYIFRPIEYRNTYYILYYILFGKDFKIFYGISLDDDYQVIDYCTRSYSP